MGKDIAGLKRGGSRGRPRGTLNRATHEVRELARRLVEDPNYLRSLQRRLIAGKAPHMETLLFQYAYGKPTDPPEGPTRPPMLFIFTKPFGYDPLADQSRKPGVAAALPPGLTHEEPTAPIIIPGIGPVKDLEAVDIPPPPDPPRRSQW